MKEIFLFLTIVDFYLKTIMDSEKKNTELATLESVKKILPAVESKLDCLVRFLLTDVLCNFQLFVQPTTF